jgi:predicted short-subunit dehydrogenase-like oxidoreductase (DUF2520 family)
MKIVLIGSGNVATHLGRAFKKSGHEILQVFSNTSSNAKTLATILKCDYTNKIEKINPKADVYLIALTDDAVEGFLKKFNSNGKLIIHTSGSLPIDVLKKGSKEYGVLYPLQSFNKTMKLDLDNIPIFIEANNNKSKKIINSLAKDISKEVHEISSEQRLTLHAAAVFANNFTNHLYKIAGDILKTSGLEFDVLKPLINETTSKVMKNNPIDVQTGPASRHDDKTIKKHLELLKNLPSYKSIYELLSESIEKQSK